MNLIKDALYILAKDIANPKPDRRERHDWRKNVEIKAGLKFRARLLTYDEETTAQLIQIPGFSVDLKWFRLEPAFSGTWSHQTVSHHDPLFAPLVEGLVLVPAKLTDMLREANEKKFVSSKDLIEHMVKTGRLKLEELSALIEECHAAHRAEDQE